MKVERFDSGAIFAPLFPDFADGPKPIAFWTMRYRRFKRASDILFCIAAAPIVGLFVLILLLLNPVLNPGPLFFRQERMGMGGVRFRMWKFRTMRPSDVAVRAHDAPLEVNRITPLGHFLRSTHLDELPNFINIARGEMTLVGPRPDAWDHAIKYIDTIPHYRERFRVRPGITGLAQVRCNYADSPVTLRQKARLDRFYVRKSRMKLDLMIIFETVLLVLRGAKPRG